MDTGHLVETIRWPAEWEEQEAVWFSWPHRKDTFQGKYNPVEHTFIQLLSTVARFQKVCINADKNLWKSIREALGTDPNIELYPHPTNDVWCRDHGATFVKKEGNLWAVDWHFNAWGGKFPPWELDDQVARHMAEATCAPTDYIRSPLFIEGGAIEGNGAGVVITTEAVALNTNRNPDWNKNEVEAELKRCLGAETIFWLPAGIEGDDTDGHIDDLTRFITEDAILSIATANSKDINYRILKENSERLQDLRTVTGSSVEIINLHLPDPIVASDWRLPTLPASYANFLIINGAVIVPTFDQPTNDDRALGILRECFPKREVIGIDCRDILFEGGAVHCLSQQQPRV